MVSDKKAKQKARQKFRDLIGVIGDTGFFWWLAKWAPFGGRVISRAGRPYLMRVYLWPERFTKTLFLSFGRVAESNGTDWGFKDPVTGEVRLWGQTAGR